MTNRSAQLCGEGIEGAIGELVADAVDTFMSRGGYRESYRRKAVAMAVENVGTLAKFDRQVSVALPSGLSEQQVNELQQALSQTLAVYHRKLFVGVAIQAAKLSVLTLSIEEQAKAHGLQLIPIKEL